MSEAMRHVSRCLALFTAVLVVGPTSVPREGAADGPRAKTPEAREGPAVGRPADPDSWEAGGRIVMPDRLRRGLRRDVLWEIGRFEVDGPPLVPERAGRDAAVDSDAITLFEGLLSIGTACPPTPARLSVHQGSTRVEARWRRCTGLPRGAELTGVIEGLSGAWLDGVFQAPGVVGRRRFHARLATCDEFGALRTEGGDDCDPIARLTLDFQRERGLFLARAYPLGFVPKGAIAKANGQLALAPIYRHPWVNLGPAPIITQGIGQPGDSGKVEAVAVDPADGMHWLVGAAGGGVWETFDAGGHWAPRTDDQPSLAAPAIAFGPGTVVYAGTGDSGIATSGKGIQGAGVLRSADGGTTWTLLGSSIFEGLSVVALQVSPDDPDVVVAAAGGAAGSLLGRYLPPGTSPPGIYRTEAGGASWTLRLAGAATDVVAHPTDFSRQYAGVKTSAPPGSGSVSDIDFGGVFRSFDGGQTWSLVEGPWSTAFSRGEIRVAVAPSAPDVVYVSVRKGPFESGADQLLGLWVTENAWADAPTWDSIPWMANDPGYMAGRPSHMILVDPSNPSVVYATGVHLWKYAGGAWADLSGNTIHVDQNALAWAGSTLLVGNDGGLFSKDEGTAGGPWTSHNTDLSITQLYHGSAHPLAPGQMLAGAQDNGVLQRIPFLPNAWVGLFSGDGFGALPGDQAQDWAFWLNGLNVFRSTSGGPFSGGVTSNDITDLTGMIPPAAPLTRCPATANTLVGGAKHLWRTDNFFSAPTTADVHWSQNSPAVDTSGNGLQGFVSAIAFAPSDPTCKTYAFGSDKGLLRLTKDGGTNWTDLDPGGGVPNRYVTGLAFSPASASTLYVTLGGFDEGTPGQPGHVFRTDSALSASPAWANVSPPVNIPHDTVTIHPTIPTAVYVGTDLGLWVSADGGATWVYASPGEGLPRVPVLRIEADACGVTAYTFGRGVFRASVPFVCP